MTFRGEEEATKRASVCYNFKHPHSPLLERRMHGYLNSEMRTPPLVTYANTILSTTPIF